MRVVIFMKKYGFLIYLLSVLTLGILTTQLFHSGYIGSLFGGFFSVPFYMHFAYFFVAYFISVLLHELTHLIAFKVRGISIKALIVLCFVIFKHDYKWRFKINLKLLLLGGGMVMPDLKPIEDDLHYYKVSKSIQTSLIAAPIFTIILGASIVITNLFFLYNIGDFTVFSFYMLFFTVIFTLASNIATDLMYGDFKAFDKFKKDPLFKLSIVTQYVSHLTDYHLELLTNHIVKYPVSDFPNELLPVIQTLFEYQVFESTTLNPSLLERAKFIQSNPFLLKRFMRKEIYIPLAQYVIYYLDKSNETDMALSLFDTFKLYMSQLKLDDLTKTYLIKQTAHVLKIEDNSAYLNQTKHISPSRFSFIFSSLPDFYDEEEKHNKGYARFEKSINDILD